MMEWFAVYSREMVLLQKKMGKLGYIFSTVMFPLIYLFAFGLGIGSVLQVDGGYLPFLAKGMLSITVMMNSFQQTALSVSVGRFYFKTFQTLLLSPISSVQIIVGITFAGVTRAFIAGGIIYLIAMVFFDVPMLSMAGIIGILLSSVCFGILGIAIGLWIKNPDALSSVINFIITPMTFFCGTFFPLNNLPSVLQSVIGILPLTLANNLLRSEGFSTDILADIMILVIITAVLFVLGIYQLKNYHE
ncbi:MAG TPA: ABC transporter permease [Candidatus Megamonas gallistercoris]|nr:ABC transporter permease [Candidatus Megamonas gallistercoris]